MSSVLRLGHFLRNYEKLYKLWNLGHAYILKSKGQTYEGVSKSFEPQAFSPFR